MNWCSCVCGTTGRPAGKEAAQDDVPLPPVTFKHEAIYLMKMYCKVITVSRGISMCGRPTIFTARVHSTTGRYCFHRCLSVHTWGVLHLCPIIIPLVPCPLWGSSPVTGPRSLPRRYPSSWSHVPSRGGAVPHSQTERGTPVPGGSLPQEGSPWARLGWGYPLARSGWGYPRMGFPWPEMG